MVIPAGVLVVDGFTGFNIGADHIESHGIFLVSVEIKDIQLTGHLAIAEFRVIEIAGLRQGADAAVPGIVAEPDIVAEYPPNLTGFIIAPKGSTGGDTDGAVELDAVLHQHIHDPGGEQSPHGAAL